MTPTEVTYYGWHRDRTRDRWVVRRYTRNVSEGLYSERHEDVSTFNTEAAAAAYVARMNGAVLA